MQGRFLGSEFDNRIRGRKFDRCKQMNYRHPWYPLVFTLQKWFGRLAIPGLIRFLAVFQFMVTLIEHYYAETRDSSYIQMLSFDIDKILSGQVWRVFSFVFIGPMDIIWGVFVMLIMWFINDVLERAWGAFTVCFYVLATVLLQIGALVLISGLSSPGIASAVTAGLSMFCGTFLYCSIFMATAAYMPNYEFRLFLLIPVKLKWLAVVAFAGVLMSAMSLGVAGYILLAASLLPYAVVFVPNFLHRMAFAQKTAERRREFKSKQIDEDEVFHRCVSCGVTDHDNPEMEFRVAADDQEYCRNCRPEEAKKEA